MKIIKEDYLRVTEILSPFSGIEFVPEQYLTPAAERGTLVHKCIEQKLSGFETAVEGDAVLPYLGSFDRFWDDSSHAFRDGRITLEKRLYCDELKITGQSDCIVRMSNRTYILDWKTSKKEHKSWRLQAAAYKYLAEVDGYRDVEDVLFVKLDKDGKKPKLYQYDTYAEDLETFKKCLELYRWFDMSKTRRKN